MLTLRKETFYAAIEGLPKKSSAAFLKFFAAKTARCKRLPKNAFLSTEFPTPSCESKAIQTVGSARQLMGAARSNNRKDFARPNREGMPLGIFAPRGML